MRSPYQPRRSFPVLSSATSHRAGAGRLGHSGASARAESLWTQRDTRWQATISRPDDFSRTAVCGIAGPLPPLHRLGDHTGSRSHDFPGAGAERHDESQTDRPRAVSHPDQRRGINRRAETERTVRPAWQLSQSLHGSTRGYGSSSRRTLGREALDPSVEDAPHAPPGQPDAIRARALHS